MKIERFKERLFENSADWDKPKLRIECRKLLEKCFDSLLSKIGVTQYINEYVITCTVGKPLSNITYKNYKEILDLFEKLNLKYEFDVESLYVEVNDIDIFMNELRFILDAKKYNL